jgi:hypothetical protein
LAKRAGIGQAEDLLQQFDLLDGLFRVHACSNIHNQAGEVKSNCKTRVRGPTASISSGGTLGRWCYSVQRRKMRAPFVPPKPNEFDRA